MCHRVEIRNVAHSTFYPIGNGGPSLGSKVPEPEGGHSLSFSAKTKMHIALPPLASYACMTL